MKNVFSWEGKLDLALSIIGTAMVFYHMTATQYVLLSPLLHQNVHLGFSLTLIFLLGIKKAKSGSQSLLLALFVLLSLASVAYIHLFFDELIIRQLLNTGADLIIGGILIVLVFEATRRSFGTILPIVAMIFLIYPFIGPYFPSPFQTHRIPYLDLIPRWSIGLTGSGIYGTELTVSANYVFLFIVFGVFIRASPASDFFEELGRLIGNKVRGGPALTSVVTSAVFGMVSGSALSNVIVTGSFTIPMMKNAGYRSEQAAAIEAGASTGGIIMPPVMGAVAFLMSALTGIPYLRIIVVAIIPAVIYYLLVGTYVRLQAVRMNILTPPVVVNFKRMLRGSIVFFLSLGAIIILLMVGYSPMFTAFYAIVTVIITTLVLNGINRQQESLTTWLQKFKDGAIAGAQIAVACACIGPVAATIIFSGLSVTIPGSMETLVGGHLIPALLLTWAFCIILGCGIPSFASYLVVAIAFAPVLMRMGIPLLQTHFFILIACVSAGLTPPVATTALVASVLAGSNYVKTAIEACKISFALFLLPFLVIACPVLLLQPTSLFLGVIQLTGVVVGLFSVAIGINSFFLIKLSLTRGMLFFVSGFSLLSGAVSGNFVYFAFGIALFISLVLWEIVLRLRTGRFTLDAID